MWSIVTYLNLNKIVPYLLFYDRNSFNSTAPNFPTPLSATIIKSKDIAVAKDTVKMLKLIDPSTGKPDGHIIVDVQLKTLSEAMSYEEHTVYQYQRFQPSKFRNKL